MDELEALLRDSHNRSLSHEELTWLESMAIDSTCSNEEVLAEIMRLK